MVKVPVGTIQLGCVVALAVGALGPGGSALTATIVAAEIQPDVVFLTVMLKVVLGDNPEKVMPLW